MAILAIVALELAHRSALDASRNARSGRSVVVRMAFQSGIEIARAMLAEKRAGAANGYDSLADEWTKPVEVRLESATIRVRLFDEMGKLDLSGVREKSDAGARIRKSLKRVFEWLTINDAGHSKEWEQARDAMIQYAEKPAAGAMELATLDDLRSLGLSSEQVFGKDNAPEAPCLRQFLTLYSGGKINLNTAPLAVLYSFGDEFDASLTEAIDHWRGTDAQSAAGIRPFKTVKDLEQVPGIIVRTEADGQACVIKNLYSKVQDSVTVLGRYFSARIDVSIEGRRHTGFVVLDARQTGALKARVMAFEEIEP